MSTYLDLPFTASLVTLWLCHAHLLDWTYTSDAMRKALKIHLSWDLGFFENFDLFENILFFPEGLSEAFIGCMTLLTLHPYFRQENIYPIQCVMQCMIMNDMSEYSNSFFIRICFVPLF